MLLVPQFSMIAFAAMLEPLRAANRLSGRELYAWSLYSGDGARVAASNGIGIDVDGALEDCPDAELLVVCAGLDPLRGVTDRRIHAQLRRLARRGATVGAVSTGSFLLAEAGLLDGRRCTVHWEYAPTFRARHPRLDLVEDLYVIDGPVFCGSGGTAGLDLMLRFVEREHGSELALRVAEQFIHPRIRADADRQRMDLSSRYGLHHGKLVAVIRAMQSALERPLDMTALGRRAGLSPRQVERLFRRHLQVSPRRFYRRIRLEHGRTLLIQTAAPIVEVAAACGFESPSHFSRAYRGEFARTPSEERGRVARHAAGRRRAGRPAPVLG